MTRIQDLPHLLNLFVRNPVGTMKIPMRMSWPASLTLQIGFALLSGAVSGLVAHSFLDFIAGLILFPLTSLVIGFIFTGFFFSFFSVFRTVYLDLHRLHSIVVLSLIPYFLLHIFSGFIPPMDLLGFALTAALLIVGLVEQFDLERKIVLTLVGTLTALYCVAWSVAQVRSTDSSLRAPNGQVLRGQEDLSDPGHRSPASVDPNTVAPAQPEEPTEPNRHDPNL